MSTQDNGGQAFPYQFNYGDGTVYREEGMTLLDYFAAKAMQAMIIPHDSTIHRVAEESYRLAAAMIQARPK
jgi:hypothetical protein